VATSWQRSPGYKRGTRLHGSSDLDTKPAAIKFRDLLACMSEKAWPGVLRRRARRNVRWLRTQRCGTHQTGPAVPREATHPPDPLDCSSGSHLTFAAMKPAHATGPPSTGRRGQRVRRRASSVRFAALQSAALCAGARWPRHASGLRSRLEAPPRLLRGNAGAHSGA